MRTIFLVLLACTLLNACDDGDVITAQLEFGTELLRCENNENSYLIYVTRDDPSESLTVLIPRNAQNDILFSEVSSDTLITDMSDVRFNYRTYNRAINEGELCEVVQPADLIILEDYEAENGAEIIFSSTIVDDDMDGIPSVDEGRGDPDEDGNFPFAEDTDGDTIPDYLDQDDDNDNVLTEDELDDDGNIMDTDDDGTPDHLDTDDDGDTIPTIEEDEAQDMNPRNDTVIENGESIPYYLTVNEDTSYGNPGLRMDNAYQRTVTTSIRVRNFNIEILRQDDYFLGTFINNRTIESF